MKKQTTHLLLSICICMLFAWLGAILTGDHFDWFNNLKQPWFALSILGWMIVGGLYYLMTIWILFRTLNLQNGKFKTLILVLVCTMMLGNESWNYLLFGMESTYAALIGLIPFAIIVLLLFYLFIRHDRTSAWILSPYVAWLGYDLCWIYQLWLLNQ